MKHAARTICYLLAVSSASAAAEPSSLYEGRTIVTGTDERSRPEGLVQALRSVLIKVSGDRRLLKDPRLDVATETPSVLVEDFVYLDRMSDYAHHDEQGTRDRPFDLIVHFNPVGVDARLSRLEEVPWQGPRPRLVLEIGVTDRSRAAFPLTPTEEGSERMRRAALAAGDLYGLRVALPGQDMFMRELPDRPTARLSGDLRWSEADHGWDGDWSLEWQGHRHVWGIAGVSFDEAFRDAVGGAARILSDHDGPG